MKLTNELSRRDNSVLFQLRSGHAPLNVHLHRIKRAESPTCDACDEADETVTHYIYDCPARMMERHKLRKAAGKEWRDRAHLLVRGTKALVEYVRATGRMRWGRREDDVGRPEEHVGGIQEGDEGHDEGRGERTDGLDEGEEADSGEEEEEEGQRMREMEQGQEDTMMEGLLRWFAGLPKEEEERQDETQRERDATTRAD